MDRLDTLLERLLSQELTAEEELEFKALLLNSEEARRRFWDASEIDMMLRDHHDAERPPPPTVAMAAAAAAAKKKWTSPVAFAVSMCLLGILLLLGWQALFNQSRNQKPERGLAGAPMAEVSGSRDTTWQHLPKQFEGPLPAGEYHLQTGITQLHWPSGATAALQGPAHFVLKEAEVLDLRAGQAGVHVPEGAIGFIVRTPNGDVVDHGTDFGVRVADNKTDAHLFSGEIEVVSGKQRLRLSDPGAVAFRDATDFSTDGSAKPASFPLPRQERILAVTSGFDQPARWGSGKPQDFGIWDGDAAEVVSRFGGVRPEEGSGMLRFIASAAGKTIPSELIASQHLYWIDIAPYRHLVERGAVSISLACSFNRVKGDRSTDTQFGILANIYKGSGRNDAERIQQFGKKLHTNANEKDWERVEINGILPPECTMIELEIHAYENITNNVQSGEVEFAGHFADSLEGRLMVDLRAGLWPEDGILQMEDGR